MAKFQISACGSEALETKEIEAATRDEAIDAYREMWEEGLVQGLDYEFEHFTVTDENGHDEIINY